MSNESFNILIVIFLCISTIAWNGLWDGPFPKSSYMHLIRGKTFTLMCASNNWLCYSCMHFYVVCKFMLQCVCACVCVVVCVRAHSTEEDLRECGCTESQSEIKRLCETFKYKKMFPFHFYVLLSALLELLLCDKFTIYPLRPCLI